MLGSDVIGLLVYWEVDFRINMATLIWKVAIPALFRGVNFNR